MKYPFYLLSIILVLVSCSTRDIEDPKEEIHAKEITKEELRIFPDTVREENKELNYKAYILYPEFSPMGSSIDGLRKLSRGFIFNNGFVA